MGKHDFDHEILLLQGGGALGAYHAGVYEGLSEVNRLPTWVVGVSIGAITAALIAGNEPKHRVERLHAFWDRISSYSPLTWPAWFEPMRPALNQFSAGTVATFGSPGFFKPRFPPSYITPSGNPETTSFYDTSPLKETLEELVDFDLINHRDTRISLGAVNVRTGQSIYFDNHKTRIGPEHVMASGALPPGFPAVQIDGEYYWDGGIVNNSPLNYIWDEKPLTSALIVQVDLFNASGKLPTTLDEVLERQKDIQYASKQRVSTDRFKEFGEIRQAVANLLEKLPPKLKSDPDAQLLASHCDNRKWMIARLVNKRLTYVSKTKDYEFSRATVQDHWSAALEDIRQAITNQTLIEPNNLFPGVQIWDLADK
jgi:NTE family protein